MYQTEKEVEKENLAGSTLHCGTLQYAASASIDDATASPHSASLHMKIYPACNESVIIVDYTRKSGDGGFADESGEELEG